MARPRLVNSCGQRVLTAAFATAAVLAILLWHSVSGVDENAPVGTDFWPTIAGVTIVKSEGLTGSDCDDCEDPQTGRRMITLSTALSPDQASKLVAGALDDAGWARGGCTHKDCFHHDGVFVEIYPHDNSSPRRKGIDLTVWLVRDPA